MITGPLLDTLHIRTKFCCNSTPTLISLLEMIIVQDPCLFPFFVHIFILSWAVEHMWMQLQLQFRKRQVVEHVFVLYYVSFNIYVTLSSIL